MEKTLIISPSDNVAVALTDIKKGETISFSRGAITLIEDVAVKHKVALEPFEIGDTIVMYGVPVGEVLLPISAGGRLEVTNVRHRAADYKYTGKSYMYKEPEVSHLKEKTFDGYHREDGQVGTGNYWLFIPMVFCQNRNLLVLKEAFEQELGFKRENP